MDPEIPKKSSRRSVSDVGHLVVVTGDAWKIYNDQTPAGWENPKWW